MSTPDEELATQLRDALREADAVSARHRRDARAAFAWRTIDAELLELGHDTLVGAAAGVRGEGEVRLLSFSAGDLSLELELAEGVVTGQLLPAQAARITVQAPAGVVVVLEVDESGFFQLDPAPAGSIRLRLECESGTLMSRWLTL